MNVNGEGPPSEPQHNQKVTLLLAIKGAGATLIAPPPFPVHAIGLLC